MRVRVAKLCKNLSHLHCPTCLWILFPRSSKILPHLGLMKMTEAHGKEENESNSPWGLLHFSLEAWIQILTQNHQSFFITLQPFNPKSYPFSFWTFLTHSIPGRLTPHSALPLPSSPHLSPPLVRILLESKNLRVSNEGAQPHYAQTSNILMWATEHRKL